MWRRREYENKFVLTKEGTKKELQRDITNIISQIGLQVVYCRLFGGKLRVVYRLFAVCLQSGIPT